MLSSEKQFFFHVNAILTVNVLHNSDLINNSNQENVYIFNIVINKYSIFVRKNVLSRKRYVFTIPKGVQWNLLITLTFLINGNQKFDPHCPSFCGQSWTFDIGLVMQSKSRI